MDHQHPAIGMKRGARSRAGFLGRLPWHHVGKSRHQTGFIQTSAYEFALIVDIRIDFVGHAVVALIAVEANVVRGGADPQFLPLHLEWRFPQTKMMALRHHLNGNRMRQAVVLHAAE